MAGSVPAHGAAGCGALHRNALIGGAAYGMPRNVHDSAATTPWTSPLTVDTKHAGCALVVRLTSGATRTDAAIATRTPADRINGLVMFAPVRPRWPKERDDGAAPAPEKTGKAGQTNALKGVC